MIMLSRENGILEYDRKKFTIKMTRNLFIQRHYVEDNSIIYDPDYGYCSEGYLRKLQSL